MRAKRIWTKKVIFKLSLFIHGLPSLLLFLLGFLLLANYETKFDLMAAKREKMKKNEVNRRGKVLRIVRRPQARENHRVSANRSVTLLRGNEHRYTFILALPGLLAHQLLSDKLSYKCKGKHAGFGPFRQTCKSVGTRW